MAGVYSVSQVNAYIKNMFAQDFALKRISIKGEVSNCKYHPSGHIYFTLKDGAGTLAAVMFSSYRKGLSFQLSEGQRVVVSGSVEVYERDGRYQLYARTIELDGIGDLYERFCRLRDELEEMGMFAPEYKQAIPQYVKSVGIVTASTGAAIRDIINIASRRNPYVQLVLYPALVQGEGAAASIVKGIRTLDKMGLDVLIVGRGGGSIEDLWAFNEETVARAFFECGTPVISAVGHETDVTIADYVADLRAPTPSAAAELAVFDYMQFERRLEEYSLSLNQRINVQVQNYRAQMEHRRLRLEMYHPGRQLRERRQQLADLEEKLLMLMERRLTADRHRLAVMAQRLQGLSPLEKISRGFGFITDSRDKRVESLDSICPGDRVKVRVQDGSFTAKVEQLQKLAQGE